MRARIRRGSRNQEVRRERVEIHRMIIHCPNCESACFEEATDCPKCGHPLAAGKSGGRKDDPVGQVLRNAVCGPTGDVNLTRVVKLIGALAVAIFGFWVLSISIRGDTEWRREAHARMRVEQSREDVVVREWRQKTFWYSDRRPEGGSKRSTWRRSSVLFDR